MDWVTIVTNLGQDMEMGGPVWTAISALCYVFAVVFAATAAYQLRDLADEKREMTARGPILSLGAAVMMGAAPAAIGTVYGTFFGDNAPVTLSYVGGGNAGQGIEAVFRLVKVIGYCFFVRGIYVLKKAGEPRPGPNATVGGSVVFMTAGMCAIYIETTLTLVANVTGWNLAAWLA